MPDTRGFLRVMTAEEIERRWQDNPLDTTFPRIPWWHRTRICDCLPTAHHHLQCIESPVYASLRPDLASHWDERSWMGRLPTIGEPGVGHEWLRCDICSKMLGEINHAAHVAVCKEDPRLDDLRDWR